MKAAGRLVVKAPGKLVVKAAGWLVVTSSCCIKVGTVFCKQKVLTKYPEIVTLASNLITFFNTT